MSAKSKAKEERRWHIQTGIPVAALLVSAVSLYFSIYGTPGTIRPIKPTGYCIIRGDGPFPSDHIVLPLEWENTSGKPIVIRQPELILHEQDGNGQKAGNKYRFILAGEYQEISNEEFIKQYAFKNSFVVEARSIPLKVLMFHYERWWDDTDKFYNIQFKSGQRYKVSIRFQPNLEKIREIELFELPIYGSADNLQTDRTKVWWCFWNLDN